MYVLNHVMRSFSSIVGDGAAYGIVALLKALHQVYQLDSGGHRGQVDEHSLWVQTVTANELYRYLSGRRTKHRPEPPIQTEVVRDDDGHMMGYVLFVPLLFTPRTPRTRAKRWYRYRLPHIVVWFSFGEYSTDDVRYRLYGVRSDVDEDRRGVLEINLVLCDEVSAEEHEWLNVVFSALWGGWYSAITHTHND